LKIKRAQRSRNKGIQKTRSLSQG